MRNLLLLLFIPVITCCGQSPYPRGADGLGDPYFPQLGNAGYDAHHYELELDIDPKANTVSGICTLQALATQSIGSFNMDFYGLAIGRIEVNGKKARYERNERELTVKPSKPVQEGEDFIVSITYSGTPTSTPALGAPFQSGWIHTSADEVFVSSETSGSANWFPVNDHPLDKASYRFLITVPKPYVVAANGLLIKEIDLGDKITYIWESPEPMASYLATINIAEYIVETETGPDGVVIRNYLPADFPGDLKHGIEQTEEMLEFFSHRFGPYPFQAYGTVIVEMPDDYRLAMETQTLSQHDPSVYALSKAIVAHELAHQWFGNSVSLEKWQDIWLKEGAATYAEWLWEEEQKGTEALITRVRGVYQLQAWSSHKLTEPPMNNIFTDTVFDRGALTLHALRERLGDEVFFNILRAYTDRYRYGNASTDDFIQVAQEVSGEDLNDFFEGWLNMKKIPPIPEMELDI